MLRTLLVAAVLVGTSSAVLAQEALRLDAPRTLHQVEVDVKGPNGPAVYRYTTTYDPASGEYVRLIEDTASGEVVKRQVMQTAMLSPTKEEQAYAEARIAEDPEIAGLIAAAEHPVEISGGFPLVREEDAGLCGLGSRCVQYDVFEVIPNVRDARRLRYVVVDLRTGQVVSRDLDPVWEGNLANPAIRADSRSRDAAFPTDSE